MLGIQMRKLVLLAAVVLAAALSVKSDIAVAQTDPNPNTTKLMRDAMNPYGATATSAKPAKVAKKGKKGKKKSKK